MISLVDQASQRGRLKGNPEPFPLILVHQGIPACLELCWQPPLPALACSKISTDLPSSFVRTQTSENEVHAMCRVYHGHSVWSRHTRRPQFAPHMCTPCFAEVSLVNLLTRLHRIVRKQSKRKVKQYLSFFCKLQHAAHSEQGSASLHAHSTPRAKKGHEGTDRFQHWPHECTRYFLARQHNTASPSSLYCSHQGHVWKQEWAIEQECILC